MVSATCKYFWAGALPPMRPILFLKEKSLTDRVFKPEGRLNGFFYFSGTDAGGADPQGFVLSVNHYLDFLQVGFPAAIGHFMGMADIVAVYRFFPAYIAYFCHGRVLLSNYERYFTLFCG
jgi:hypothetical protein